MWFKRREQRWTRSEERPAPAVPRTGGAEVVLLDAGEHKIQVIKAIREYTGLGLADAKDLSERPGESLGSYLPAVAEAFASTLASLGARAEVRGTVEPFS